jgi:hypothetical protein
MGRAGSRPQSVRNLSGSGSDRAGTTSRLPAPSAPASRRTPGRSSRPSTRSRLRTARSADPYLADLACRPEFAHRRGGHQLVKCSARAGPSEVLATGHELRRDHGHELRRRVGLHRVEFCVADQCQGGAEERGKLGRTVAAGDPDPATTCAERTRLGRRRARRARSRSRSRAVCETLLTAVCRVVGRSPRMTSWKIAQATTPHAKSFRTLLYTEPVGFVLNLA